MRKNNERHRTKRSRTAALILGGTEGIPLCFAGFDCLPAAIDCTLHRCNFWWPAVTCTHKARQTQRYGQSQKLRLEEVVRFELLDFRRQSVLLIGMRRVH